MNGMRLTIEQAKGNFFDRVKIEERVERARVRNLSRLAAYIRTRAITILLRHPVRKSFGAASKVSNRQGTAPAGQAPYMHTGDIAKFLFFAFDQSTGTAIVGPALLHRAASTLKELEEGGPATITVKRRGKPTTVQAQFKAHPFMRPALDAEKARSAKLWENTVR